MAWWNRVNVEGNTQLLLAVEDPSLPFLQRAERSAARVKAAESLGRTKDPRARAALFEALGTTPFNVVEAAAKSLRKGRFDLTLAERTIVAIKLREFDAALSMLRTLEVGVRPLEPLSCFLQIWSWQDTVSRAIATLTTLGDDDCMPALCKGFENSDFEVRRACVRALATFGDRAIPALERALVHPDKHVNCEAANVLGNLGGQRATTLLSTVVLQPKQTSDSPLVLGAVGALARVGGAATVRPLIEAVRHGGQERVIALRALGAMQDPTVANELRAFVGTTPDSAFPQADEFVEVAILRCGATWGVTPFIALFTRVREREEATVDIMESYHTSVRLAQAAYKVLPGLLERYGADVTADDLKTLAALGDLTFYDTKEHDDFRVYKTAQHCVEFSQIRDLAERELIRRGLQGA